MESSVGTSGASAEKDKGKKSGRTPRGKEDKDQMKYQFQGDPLHSKVTTDWKEITDTNIGQVDMDEFTQRVRVNPTTKNVRLIRQSGIAKAASFPPSLVAPELVMAC